MSYAFALHFAGSVKNKSTSSSITIVNGWCIATNLCSSSLYSNNGNSTTHKKLYLFSSIRFSSLPKYNLSAPSACHTISFLSAANKSKSPFSQAIAFLIFSISSSFKNLEKLDLTVPSSSTAI